MDHPFVCHQALIYLRPRTKSRFIGQHSASVPCLYQYGLPVSEGAVIRTPSIRVAAHESGGVYETGPPDVLRYEDVPDPACPDGFVLIDVEAISIEGGDPLNRAV